MRVPLRLGGCRDTRVRERRWEPSTLPGPGTHTLPASCVPLLKSAALTVFSFSDRLSRFSGDTLSCCWSVMVASGTRAESMASEGSGRGDGDSGGAARTRSTGERQTLHLLKGPRRGRARASYWLERAPGAGVAPSSLPHKDLHGVCADPGGARALGGPEPFGVVGGSALGEHPGWGARGVAAEVGATAWRDAAGLRPQRLHCLCVPAMGVRGNQLGPSNLGEGGTAEPHNFRGPQS